MKKINRMNRKTQQSTIFISILLAVLTQTTIQEILDKEHCPAGCLRCIGKLETQSYLKKCLKCDTGYYEYLGSCHNCPNRCTICGSDRVCLRCNKFFTWEADECVFSWLDFTVRMVEMLIVMAIAYMCCYSFQKYRKQQEKYETELEIRKLSSKSRKKGSKKGKSKSGKSGKKKKRKSQIRILDESTEIIDMDKTVDQSGLMTLIDEES